MMRKLAFLFVLVLAGSYLSMIPCPWTLCNAAPGSPQGMNFTVEGKVHSRAQNKLTLSTEANIIFHVRYDDKTEIKSEDGSAASAKDLRVGLNVRVDGDLTESGEIVAQKIVIQQKPAQKKSSSLGESFRCP